MAEWTSACDSPQGAIPQGNKVETLSLRNVWCWGVGDPKLGRQGAGRGVVALPCDTGPNLPGLGLVAWKPLLTPVG